MKYCTCKGIRTCAICNPEKLKCESTNCITCYFCPNISKVVKETCCPETPCHDFHTILGDFNGITLIENFLSETDKILLLNGVHDNNWVESQSGRRKQDFGPKVNFKKHKVNMTKFQGLPNYIEEFVNRFPSIKDLESFNPVELCNLEYNPVKGASIDPHFDDFWLWGERLVTLNVQASTYLTFNPGTQDALQLCSEMFHPSLCSNNHEDISNCKIDIKVPMVEGSLIIVYGDARYKWMHSIKTTDIHSTRIAITLRELSHEYVKSDPESSSKLIELAMGYNGVAVV